MSLISKVYTFVTGQTIVAAQHNANFDTIYNDYNGNITNANISASAAIDPSKIAGGVSTVVRSTFDNGDLSTGVLTITHTLGLTAPYIIDVTIFDNNGKKVFPDDVTGATNTVVVDLTSFGTLTGNWAWEYTA